MVLEDHVRKGKKLLPKLIAMNAPVQETNWHCERLPELFWIAFVANRLGDREAMELAFQMTQAVQATLEEVRVEKKTVRAYIMSEHRSFSEVERAQIARDAHDAAWRKALNPHFTEMATIWADLPTAYLITNHADDNGVGARLVEEVKGILRRCFHRHDKNALIIQAIAVATEFRTGHMMVAPGIDVPDLNLK